MMAPQASAQVLYGSLVGTVTDQTQGVIPNAMVRVTNVATNQTREARSGSSGRYSFNNVPSGTYDVTVTSDGFRTYTRRGVNVAINDVIRVDVAMEVGAVTESVEVSAQAAALQTERGEVRSEMSSKTLVEMPAPINRNYENLFVMLPGFSPPERAHSVSANPTRGLQFSVNGTTMNTNNIRVEGATATNSWLPHVSAYIPAMDSIEEVSVVTSSLDADQGLTGGAAINVQMKSGTNSFHGTAFWYHFDNKLKAKPFFLAQGERNPKNIDNTLGGSLGGPIIKNKVFFFGGYEGQFTRQNAFTYVTVANAAMKAGDMSGSSNPVFDPRTGNPDGKARIAFPGNQIPQSRWDPVIPKLLALTPLPTYPDELSNNYFASGSYTNNRHKYDTKINYNANNKLTFSGRLGALDYIAVNPNVFGDNGPGVSSAASRDRDLKGTVYNTSGSATYVFSPTFLIDGHIGFTRLDTIAEPPHLDENLGLDELGLPGTNGPSRNYGGYPSFAVSSFTSFGKSSNAPIVYTQPAWDMVANANWTKGNHNIRFGGDVSLQANNNFELGGAGGSFQFNGSVTSLNGGPSPNQYNHYAAFLLGLTTSASNNLMAEDRATTRTKAFSFYVRDGWQATRRLSLSLGLRWTYFPMGVSKDRGFRKYNWATDEMYVCGEGSIPRDCGVKVPKKLFSPRIGIAYRATNTFVIRTGFGINYDPQPLAFARDLIGSGERQASANWPAAPNSYTPRSQLSDGIPPVILPDLSSGIIHIPLTQGFATPPDEYHMGYIMSWNFTLEKELGAGFIAQAGYVGTSQVKELQYLNINTQRVGGGRASQLLYQKFGRTGSANLITNFGHHTYNSLQTTLKRSFSNGIQFYMSYTWSKSIGTCCDLYSDKNPRINDPDYSGLNKALFSRDRAHNFNISTVAELPFGKGRRFVNRDGAASAILGGWQVSGLFTAYSGRPFDVTASGSSLNASGNTQRADQVKPEVAILGGTGPGQSWFDPLAFEPVTAARLGTAGYSTLRGPGLVNLDFSLMRSFQLTESIRFELRGEALNFTNTPHFNNPSGNVSNLQLNSDGTVKNLGGYTEIRSIANVGREGMDERVIRVGLRFRF
jgi:Carboxypeptidase regulatory-like domain/TonB dependent receptor-like, beta-barrel